MEATIVWAGVWTGVTVSSFLIIPIIIEFCKRNLPIFFGIVMTVLALYLLAPASPEIRAVWVPLSQLPATLLISVGELFSKLIP